MAFAVDMPIHLSTVKDGQVINFESSYFDSKLIDGGFTIYAKVGTHTDTGSFPAASNSSDSKAQIIWSPGGEIASHLYLTEKVNASRFPYLTIDYIDLAPANKSELLIELEFQEEGLGEDDLVSILRSHYVSEKIVSPLTLSFNQPVLSVSPRTPAYIIGRKLGLEVDLGHWLVVQDRDNSVAQTRLRQRLDGVSQLGIVLKSDANVRQLNIRMYDPTSDTDKIFEVKNLSVNSRAAETEIVASISSFVSSFDNPSDVVLVEIFVHFDETVNTLLKQNVLLETKLYSHGTKVDGDSRSIKLPGEFHTSGEVNSIVVNLRSLKDRYKGRTTLKSINITSIPDDPSRVAGVEIVDMVYGFPQTYSYPAKLYGVCNTLAVELGVTYVGKELLTRCPKIHYDFQFGRLPSGLSSIPGSYGNINVSPVDGGLYKIVSELEQGLDIWLDLKANGSYVEIEIDSGSLEAPRDIQLSLEVPESLHVNVVNNGSEIESGTSRIFISDEEKLILRVSRQSAFQGKGLGLERLRLRSLEQSALNLERKEASSFLWWSNKVETFELSRNESGALISVKVEEEATKKSVYKCRSSGGISLCGEDGKVDFVAALEGIDVYGLKNSTLKLVLDPSIDTDDVQFWLDAEGKDAVEAIWSYRGGGLPKKINLTSALWLGSVTGDSSFTLELVFKKDAVLKFKKVVFYQQNEVRPSELLTKGISYIDWSYIQPENVSVGEGLEFSASLDSTNILQTSKLLATSSEYSWVNDYGAYAKKPTYLKIDLISEDFVDEKFDIQLEINTDKKSVIETVSMAVSDNSIYLRLADILDEDEELKSVAGKMLIPSLNSGRLGSVDFYLWFKVEEYVSLWASGQSEPLMSVNGKAVYLKDSQQSEIPTGRNANTKWINLGFWNFSSRSFIEPFHFFDHSIFLVEELALVPLDLNLSTGDTVSPELDSTLDKSSVWAIFLVIVGLFLIVGISVLWRSSNTGFVRSFEWKVEDNRLLYLERLNSVLMFSSIFSATIVFVLVENFELSLLLLLMTAVCVFHVFVKPGTQNIDASYVVVIFLICSGLIGYAVAKLWSGEFYQVVVISIVCLYLLRSSFLRLTKKFVSKGFLVKLVRLVFFVLIFSCLQYFLFQQNRSVIMNYLLVFLSAISLVLLVENIISIIKGVLSRMNIYPQTGFVAKSGAMLVGILTLVNMVFGDSNLTNYFLISVGACASLGYVQKNRMKTHKG